MKILFFYTILLVIISSCSNIKKDSIIISIDTILFENEKPNSFIDKVGQFKLVKFNDEELSRLQENLATKIKVKTGKISDLKLKLIPITENLEIKKINVDSNFFEIKSQKLPSGKESESAKFYIMQDTSHRKIVFMNREYEDSLKIRWQDYIMNWRDTIGTFELKIKKNIN